MRNAGLAPLTLGSLAVLAGVIFLWAVGALPSMISRNLVAFFLGLALGLACHRAARSKLGASGLFLAASTILFLVLITGVEIEGVRRWLQIGPITLQPALIFCPLLLALADGQRDRRWRLAPLLPLALIALQPDAATLIAFATGVAMLVHRDVRTAGLAGVHAGLLTGLVVIVAALVALALAGPRTPPPVAFVEGTIALAATSATAMLLHLLATALMLASLFSGSDGNGRSIASYFLIITIAAIFWSFPMPLAGASASHLIGFGLAVGWLTAHGRAARSTVAPAA